jgi:hypothetical protein
LLADLLGPGTVPKPLELDPLEPLSAGGANNGILLLFLFLTMLSPLLPEPLSCSS